MSGRGIGQMLARWYPPGSHPYKALERAIDARIGPQATVLDIGCGRTAPDLSRLKGKAGRLIGIDVMPFAIRADGLELLTAGAATMPSIGTATVDLAYSRAVMEHLDDPEAALAEIARVLRPGGHYLALTPSLWDYASLIARLVPNRFHPMIVRRTEGRAEADTFPTRYRANTRTAIERLARRTGLTLAGFEYLGQYPNYLIFSPVLFRLGCRYERFLSRHPVLHPLLGWIFFEMVKPKSGPVPWSGGSPATGPRPEPGPPGPEKQG